MADSIVRLKVENSEYDAKIKRAAQGLQHMEEACRKVNGTLAVLEKEDKAFVEGLGKMETVSKDARGRINELTKAFTDLSVQYNRLTDEEKKGDYGKALNKSLGELKTRITDAKKELNSIQGEISTNGSMLDQLSGKFGINIKQLGGWGAAIGAGKIALDVMKDAFFASEANLDEWNRAVYAGESAWDAFLTSINTGDISGFLGKIDSIVNAARDAYNEMDRLSTQKAINNPAVKAQEAENERFRAMLRTGRYIAPNDGRKASMQEGQVLTDAQKKRIASMLESGMQKLNGFVRDEITQTTSAIDALYKQQASQLGMSLKEFRAGTANMDAFDERIAGYKQYKQYEAKRDVIRSRANSGQNISDADSAILRGANPYQQYKAWGVFKDDGNLYGQINDLINQRASLQSQNYGNTANAYRAINRATGTGGGGTATTTAPVKEILPKAVVTESLTELQILEDQLKTVKNSMKGYGEGTEEWKAMNEEVKSLTEQIDKLNGKTVEMQVGVSGLSTEAITAYIKMLQDTMKSVDLTSPLYQNLQQNLADTNALQNILQTAIQNGIDTTTFDAEGLWDKILGGENIPDGVWQSLADEINTKLTELGIEPIKIDVKTGKVDTLKKEGEDAAEAWKSATSAVSSIGSALQSIEDPAAKVMGIIAEAIANVALGFANSLKDGKMVGGPWGWIAAAAAGTATMVSTISAIKSATAEYHAQGGIVGQGPFIPRGTDTIPAMLTPGEVVLSHAQTSNVADKLQGQGISNLHLDTEISAEKFRILLRNNSRRRGHGEYVTTR